MTSRTASSFWTCFDALPQQVQDTARQKFELWKQDPTHASLQFKQLSPGVWSARVNLSYRAMALREGDVILWVWIGTHAEYDQLVRRR